MGWNNSIFPLLIVTSGTGFTGFFVYSPAPGTGNLIASITAQAGTDPYGNHYDPGITSYDNTFGGVSNLQGATLELFLGLNLLQILSPTGLFTYSPNAAAGNLIASIAEAAGTDGFTNAFKAGLTSYGKTAPFPFTNINSGTVTLGSANFATVASMFVTAIAGTSAGLAITSGTGTEAGAVASSVALGDSGSGQGGSGLYVVDGRDGTSYGTERQIFTNSLNVTLSNAAFTSIFGTIKVGATAYLIKADLLVAVGATATQLIFQLVGPAVGATTNVKWRVTFEAGTGESVFAGHSIGSLASFTAPGTTFPISSVVHVWMSAYVTFTAASGTNLNLQVELGAASAGSNVSLGSTLEVMPV